jgi:pimeloyl-ACP methyl ester carboxylesterase
MSCKRNRIAQFIAIAAAIAAAISAQSSEATEPASNECSVKAMPRDTTLLEGKRFTVQVEGKGPDVILIPGLSSPRAVWEETVKALAGCYTVHSIQIRGFGDEAGLNAEGPVLDPFITELADYIDDEIINKGRAAPAIIGHSLGGLSALMIGARHPQVAGKIMVVDALPFIGTIFGAADVAAVRPQAEAMAASIRNQYQADAAKPTLLNCDDPAEAAKVKSIWSNTPRGRCIVENWGKLSDARVTAQAMLDDTLTDMRPELPKIAAPVTLLYAQDDKVMPEAMARAIFEGQYAGTPKFTPVMVKGSYHFIMLDQPAEFLQQVAAFLKN